jgi:GTP-binding protein EngB required for normal cell division
MGIIKTHRIMQCKTGRVLDALDSISDVPSPQLLAEIGLEFPEIAVVGQESTGKSSVLERITMLPLFPRGTDIVTRSSLSD